MIFEIIETILWLDFCWQKSVKLGVVGEGAAVHPFGRGRGGGDFPLLIQGEAVYMRLRKKGVVKGREAGRANPFRIPDLALLAPTTIFDLKGREHRLGWLWVRPWCLPSLVLNSCSGLRWAG